MRSFWRDRKMACRRPSTKRPPSPSPTCSCTRARFVQLTHMSVRWMCLPQRRGRGAGRRGFPRLIARSNGGRLTCAETTERVPASGGLSLGLSILRGIGEKRPEEQDHRCVRGRRSSTLGVASCAPRRKHRSRRRAALALDVPVFHASTDPILYERILPARPCSR